LKVQSDNAKTAINPYQITPVVDWEELRFKPSVEREIAAKQQDQAKTPKTSNPFTSFHDFSLGSPLRKPEPTPGQSLMIKDQPFLVTSNQCI
ncbi:MAG: hypothetical protein EZS28_049118, partial [Streblomastix strix]